MNKQKLAIITGGESVVGFTICQKLIQAKIKTIVLAGNFGKMQNAYDLLGDLCCTIEFDLQRYTAIPGLIKYIVKNFGSIDILILNEFHAMDRNVFEMLSKKEQNRVMQPAFFLTSLLSGEASREMIQNETGCIIIIAPVLSQLDLSKPISNAVCKVALEGLTKTMAMELSPNGIRVNCIAPELIIVQNSSHALNKDSKSGSIGIRGTQTPVRGLPEDIADTVYFFSSDVAEYITGTFLPIYATNYFVDEN